MKSRQLKSDLARIKSVIEGDRRNVSADVENMLKYDLTCVLDGYFDLISAPEVEIFSSGNRVELHIAASACRMKNAGVGAAESSALR